MQQTEENINKEQELSRWWLAPAAVLSDVINFKANYNLAGLYDGDKPKDEIKDDITRYWNITNREEFLELVKDLLHSNYIGRVWQPDFSYRACCSEHQWQNWLKAEKENDQLRGEELQFIDVVYKQVGLGGFNGWDFSRGSLLTRQGLYLEWISQQEFEFLVNQFALAIQNTFSSWQQYTNSCVFGRMVNRYLSYRDEGEGFMGMVHLSMGGYAPGYKVLFKSVDDNFLPRVKDIDWYTPLPILEVPASLIVEQEAE